MGTDSNADYDFIRSIVRVPDKSKRLAIRKLYRNGDLGSQAFGNQVRPEAASGLPKNLSSPSPSNS